MSPTTTRRLLLSSLVLAALVNVGCAPDGYWVKTKEALPAFHAPQESYDALLKACKYPCGVGCVLFGCAVRVWQDNVCLIYTEKNPPKWVYDHELAHCRGWDHPGTPLLLDSDPPG